MGKTIVCFTSKYSRSLGNKGLTANRSILQFTPRNPERPEYVHKRLSDLV